MREKRFLEDDQWFSCGDPSGIKGTADRRIEFMRECIKVPFRVERLNKPRVAVGSQCVCKVAIISRCYASGEHRVQVFLVGSLLFGVDTELGGYKVLLLV